MNAKNMSHTNKQPVYPWTPVTEGKQMLPSVHQWISCHDIKEICQMLGIQNPQFHAFFEHPYKCSVTLGFNLP